MNRDYWQVRIGNIPANLYSELHKSFDSAMEAMIAIQQEQAEARAQFGEGEWTAAPITLVPLARGQFGD